MPDTPPVKRKRTADSSPADPDTTPVRSKIWMPYGDIILQAESTQFRINRDVLARHSSVFADMFSIPLPSDEPTVEGCPIVRVSDTAKDWELLLGVAYDPFQESASRPFAVVAAMLRLGKKYDIPQARDDALSRLHSEYPADLEAWDASPDLTKIEAERGIQPNLLNLMYECGVYSCIPAIGFGCLSLYSLEALFEGVKHPDGSRVTLSSDTKLILAIALERLLFFQRSALGGLENDAVIPHESCHTRNACIRSKKNIIHKATWSNIENRHEIYYVIGKWCDSWSGKLCEACETAAREYTDTSRQKGWELLPTFFGLPKWKDLKDLE